MTVESPPPPPQKKIVDAIGTATERAAQLRELAPKQRIDIQFVTRAELAERFSGDPKSRESALFAAEVLTALGVIPPRFEWDAMIRGLAQSSTAQGMYDVERGAFLVVDDADQATLDGMMVHEAVHGLQEQHFGLRNLRAGASSSVDATTALTMLTEADATSAVMGESALSYSDVELRSMAAWPPIAGVPEMVIDLMNEQYGEGLVFVSRLRASGGWPAVNEAWRSPPSSTEQILHSDKWASREPPETVTLPAAPVSFAGAALRADYPGEGWKVSLEATWGEVQLRAVLKQWVSEDEARSAAAGWGGDRVALYTDGPGRRKAVAWTFRFDAGTDGKVDGEAIEAEEAWKVPLGAASPPGTARPSSCVERPSLGPMAVLRSGRELLVLVGPYGEADRASDVTCREVLRWGKQILPKAPVTYAPSKSKKPKAPAPGDRVKPEGTKGSVDKPK